MTETPPSLPPRTDGKKPDRIEPPAAVARGRDGFANTKAEIQNLLERGAEAEAKEMADRFFREHKNNPAAVLYYADFCFSALRNRALAMSVLRERLAELPHRGIFLRLAHYQARAGQEEDTLVLSSEYFAHPNLAGFAYACYGAALLRQTGDLDLSVGFFHRAAKLLRHDKHRGPAAMAMSPGCFMRCAELDANSVSNPVLFMDGRRTDADLVVYTTGDERYFRAFYKMYRETFFACNPDAKYVLHFHIFDPSEQLLDKIRQAEKEPDAEFVNFSFERTGACNKSYYYAGRFVQMPRLLARYACPIFVTDIDCLFKSSMGELVEALDSADMGVLDLEHVLFPWQRFRAGMAAFQPTGAGMLLAKALSSFLVQAPPNRLNYVWVDQLGLAECAYLHRNLGIGNVISLRDGYAKACHQTFYKRHGYPEEKAEVAGDLLERWHRKVR